MPDSLKKLVNGLLSRSIEKQTQEPENHAVDRVSKELRFLERQWEYALEIERVLKELHITVNLVADLKSRTEKEVCGTSREDLLIYYEGSFFNLVHQMKDKILQLVNTVTEDTVPEKPTEQDDVKLKDLLEKKEKKISGLGIRTELELWDQQNHKSCVAVVLRKRTTHHHRVSQSPYNQNVLNLKFVETMLKPHTQPLLTPFQIEYLEKMRIESTERLFTDTHSKMTKTLVAIENNLDKIAQSLTTNFKLPVSDEEIRGIGLDFIQKMKNSKQPDENTIK
ncbi:MAG: hypothetical protein A3G17_08890 [Planctomycetes bacterium RIFCSPLOWO2_12_FULL_50_35]|nr:MAG: hypothetical protein A3E75_00465 [Planctomycetes bacterium RIFCSPHIGHO2_12_FULL_51_37]OHB96314.1 MAG: hypothetical protein A3I59_09010 [Planctomycetes bacterium RIFCSPLOWO2_02_FULL_50_16]OHC02789.1 MAG: hypothetical protein A3G17_08890 [Planctomycetes bacterium RIFCSPLOWO2_12_FULL_50_35]